MHGQLLESGDLLGGGGCCRFVSRRLTPAPRLRAVCSKPGQGHMRTAWGLRGQQTRAVRRIARMVLVYGVRHLYWQVRIEEWLTKVSAEDI